MRGQRRLGAHDAAPAFEAFKQRGFLAADIGAGAFADFKIESEVRAGEGLAEHAAAPRRADRVVHHRDRMRIFRADIDVALCSADGDAGDRHALDQHERIAFHDHAVGESAAVAFVGVADDVFPVGLGIGDRFPLDAGREACAAATAQAGLSDLLDDARGIGQRFDETLIAVVGFVIFERTRIDNAAACEGEACLLLQERMVFRHADAQCVLTAAGDHRIEHAVDVGELDRPIGNPALFRHDLEHRLEPMHAARTVAYDFDLDLALCRRRHDCSRNLICAAGNRCSVARNVNAERAHRSVSATRASSFLSSRRATILPSIIADGDTEHRPRQ